LENLLFHSPPYIFILKMRYGLSNLKSKKLLFCRESDNCAVLGSLDLLFIELDAWSIADGKLYLNYNRDVKSTWGKDQDAFI